MKILILVLVLLFIILQFQKKETFIDGNFELCEKNDCGCLKMNTAPDGTCVNYEISKTPLVPEYENKRIYQPQVVRNNLYPLKRDNIILIFVGIKMKNRAKRYDNLPKFAKIMEKREEGRYSEDNECHHYYEVFQNANDILSVLNGEEPYIKWIILNADHYGNDYEIMKSYQIKKEHYPAIYMYNETTNKMKEFPLNSTVDRCILLQNLLIFIADGDCGLISYLNHLEDPFLGMKFKHDSKNNKWIPDKKNGVNLYNNGTDMCKLIDYQDLPDNFKCQ